MSDWPFTLVRELLNGLKPGSAREDEARQQSVRHYHARHNHYLCLHRSHELTVKAYIIEPQCVPNESGYLVAPHTHRYAFDTWVLSGTIRHYRFEEVKERDGSYLLGTGPQYVRSKYDPVSRTLADPMPCSLRPLSVEYVRRGQHYHVRTDEIHTLTAEPNRDPSILMLNTGSWGGTEVPNIMLTLQYANRVGWSHIYGLPEAQPRFDGLYEVPEAGAMRDMVHKVTSAVYGSPIAV